MIKNNRQPSFMAQLMDEGCHYVRECVKMFDEWKHLTYNNYIYAYIIDVGKRDA